MPLALAGEFHQPQFRELSDLGSGGIIAHRLGEVLQQLQLVASRLHINEVDDHHPANVAQLELAGDFRGGLAVGPQHGFPGVGRAGEGARVDVDDRESFGEFDDHVAPRGQIHSRAQGITDRGIDAEVLQEFGGFLMEFHRELGLVIAKKTIHPRHRFGGVDHHPHHLRAVEVAQDPVDEILIPVEQNRRGGRFRSLLNSFPLPQEGFQVINEVLLAHPFGFRADQQA